MGGHLTIPLKARVLLPLIATGILVTLGTGLLGNYTYTFDGSTYWVWGYGFPFQWITGGCPPPGSGIQIPCLPINYDWLAFELDVLFYTAVGYAVVFAYKRMRHRMEPKASAQAGGLRNEFPDPLGLTCHHTALV